ncbi:MAG: hypothetical protein FRX49_11678 [Trebouxia sp. A1-2]|nr:MAG: hypothetical protein FRX49_11678 [Trebouxia sp. A1-2]
MTESHLLFGSYLLLSVGLSTDEDLSELAYMVTKQICDAAGGDVGTSQPRHHHRYTDEELSELANMVVMKGLHSLDIEKASLFTYNVHAALHPSLTQEGAVDRAQRRRLAAENRAARHANRENGQPARTNQAAAVGSSSRPVQDIINTAGGSSRQVDI